MTPGRIAARLLHPLAWHRMDLRGRLMWLAMLPVLVFAVVWGSYVIRQRDADLAAQLQQRAQLLARQLAVAADYGIFSFNQAALDNIALGVLRESSVISATIIAADGRVLATRHAPAQGHIVEPMRERATDKPIEINKRAQQAMRFTRLRNRRCSPRVIIRRWAGRFGQRLGSRCGCWFLLGHITSSLF